MATHTNPLTGARYPDSASGTDLATYYANVVNDLSPLCSQDFPTAAARDTAFANWVSQGNTMRNGLSCSIAGVPMSYRNGSWRGVSWTAATTQSFFPTTISNSTTEVGIATLAIPDPGFPYILDTVGNVAIGASAGTNVNVRIRLDSVTGTVISQDSIRSGLLPAGELIMVPLATFPTATLTGAHSLVCTARITSGTGNWNVPGTNSIVTAYIRPSFA